MPRPEKPDKKPEKKPDARKERTEADRALKHKLWDEQAERERRQDALVQKLIDEALSKKKSGQYGFDEAMAELDEILHIALAQRLLSVAARCVWYKSTLAGLVVEKHAHAIAVGGPDDFHLRGSVEEGRQRIIDRMAEKYGTKGAQKLIAKIERELKDFDPNSDDDDIVDGEATDVG